MKSRGHIYMARLIYDELVANDGWLTLQTHDDLGQKCKTTKYRVPDQIYAAVKANRGCFLAGSVGPDFFPDMVTGQMRIHPKDSGAWLEMMFEELKGLPPYGEEFQKAMAFYMGWLMHYCGDMYGHHTVNYYSFGWFPSIYEMFEDAMELMKVPELMDALDFLKRHITDEELNALVENPSLDTLNRVLLEDPAAVAELEQYFREKEQETVWEKLVELVVDIFRLFRLVNSAANIIRHMIIEAYMDGIILENLKAREDVVLDEYFDMELPMDFIRRCFTTPAAFERMQRLNGEDPETVGSNPLDVLQKFVEHYEQEYQAMLSSPGSGTVIENLELRATYMDKWVSFWLKFVENDMKFEKPIPEGHRLRMSEEIAELMSAYLSEDEDTIRKTEAAFELLNTIHGILKPVGKVLKPVGLVLEQFFYLLCLPVITTAKAIAEPFLMPIAQWVVSQKLVEIDHEIRNFDEAVAVIEQGLEKPALLIGCKLLFWEDNLPEKLREQWKQFGKKETNCFNIQCPMMENALQMGKLCLLGSDQLNEIYSTHVADVAPFAPAEVSWTLSNLAVEVVHSEKLTLPKNCSLRLDVFGIPQGQKEPRLLERRVIWDSQEDAKSGRIVKKDLRLVHPLAVGELTACHVLLQKKNSAAADAAVRCDLRLYDRDTGLILFTREGCALKTGGAGVDILPADREQYYDNILEKMENARRVNSLSKLTITVKTGSDGTDGDVSISILDRKGNTLRGPRTLDKSWQNDFEKGDYDSYDWRFDTLSNLDDIMGFKISKSGGGSWKIGGLWVTVTDETTGDGITLASFENMNEQIGKSGIVFGMDHRKLRAPELELKDDLITHLLVDIHTRDELWAGTDDNVYLEVHRHSGGYVTVELDSSRNDFERDRLDAFCVDIRDKKGRGIQRSDISSFRIYKKTPAGRMNDDWVVDEIRIRNRDGGAALAYFGGRGAEHRAHTFEEENNPLTLSAIAM